MWKTMSRPMKSASASGPIGWLAPFCIAASISAIDAEAALEARDRVDHVGHEQAVHDEAGRVRRPPPASCRASSRRPRRRSTTSCAVRSVGRDLDQLHGVHGVEEVQADEAVRTLRVAAASSATVSVEVLVAKIAALLARPRRGGRSARASPAAPRRSTRSPGRRRRGRGAASTSARRSSSAPWSAAVSLPLLDVLLELLLDLAALGVERPPGWPWP